jgi:predicted nucleic acid-binding protein
VKRAYIDANVIVRLITSDPPEMAEQAARLFVRVDAAELELAVDAVVMAETVWTLSSFYGFSTAQIAPILRTFLVSEGIVSEDKLELLQALTLYEDKNIDFVDALVAAKMIRDGIPEVYSFDSHFDRMESIRRIDPA